MSERYKFVDMNETGPGAVRTAFANQVAYCRAAEAPITARIVAAVRDANKKVAILAESSMPPLPDLGGLGGLPGQ